MFRDTTITAAMKRRELLIFLFCFLGAYILNVVGIIKYQSPARQLITQIPVVLLVTLVVYGAVVLLRILYYLVSRFWNRK